MDIPFIESSPLQETASHSVSLPVKPDRFFPDPVRDGSAVLSHDGYDELIWQQAISTIPQLFQIVEEAGQRIKTGPALIRDLFLSLNKHVPILAPPVPLSSAFALNQEILEQIFLTLEWRQLHASDTIGDLLNTAIATRLIAKRALTALDTKTIAQINRLHELESGATHLFEKASALTDLAEQAQGDRTSELFEQAQRARQLATERKEEAQALAEQGRAATEEVATAIRRAAILGAKEALNEVHAINTSVRAFTGGYEYTQSDDRSPDVQLSPQEKIALAERVGESRRLKELAAIVGRYTRIALKVQGTRVKDASRMTSHIQFSRDLVRVLPSELMWLSDPAIEDLFWYKYLLDILPCSISEERVPLGQGPIIIALDNSGSMKGPIGHALTKEIWSKAITLGMLAIARLQKRHLAVIHFAASNQLTTQLFPEGQGTYKEVIACMDHFFDGPATVFEPWMKAALHLVDEAQFKKADIVVISDGLTSISSHMKTLWQYRRKEMEMRSYAVLVEDPGREDNQRGKKSCSSAQVVIPSIGEHTLSEIVDATLTLRDLSSDEQSIMDVLFAV